MAAFLSPYNHLQFSVQFQNCWKVQYNTIWGQKCSQLLYFPVTLPGFNRRDSKTEEVHHSHRYLGKSQRPSRESHSTETIKQKWYGNIVTGRSHSEFLGILRNRNLKIKQEQVCLHAKRVMESSTGKAFTVSVPGIEFPRNRNP